MGPGGLRGVSLTSFRASSGASLKDICVCVHALSLAVSDSATPWTASRPTPLSVGFSRQEDWSGLLPSSRGSSRPQDQTHTSYVSCTGRRVLYHSAA